MIFTIIPPIPDNNQRTQGNTAQRAVSYTHLYGMSVAKVGGTITANKLDDIAGETNFVLPAMSSSLLAVEV